MRIRQLFSCLTIVTLLFLSGCDRHKQDKTHGWVEGKYTDVAAAVAGRLETLKVHAGDTVKAGEVLFTLNNMPEQAQLRQAKFEHQQMLQQWEDAKRPGRDETIAGLEADLMQAKSAMTYNLAMYKRYQALTKKNISTKATLGNYRTLYASSLAQFNKAKSALDKAQLGQREYVVLSYESAAKAAKANMQQIKWQLSEKQQRSSVAGKVYQTYYEPGEFVSAGSPVLSILALENEKIIFFIPNGLISKYRVGQTVNFSCQGCGDPLPATISVIYDKAEFTPPMIYSEDMSAKFVYRVEAKISPKVADKVHPGLPIDVVLKTGA